jgi:hypothetical protein
VVVRSEKVGELERSPAWLPKKLLLGVALLQILCALRVAVVETESARAIAGSPTEEGHSWEILNGEMMRWENHSWFWQLLLLLLLNL